MEMKGQWGGVVCAGASSQGFVCSRAEIIVRRAAASGETRILKQD